MSESTHPLPFELAAIWPDGLNALFLTTGFSRSQLDPAKVELALEERGCVFRRRNTGLLFPLRGRGEFEGFWGRVDFSVAPDQLLKVRDGVITVGVWPEDDQEVAPPESMSLEEFPSLLESIATAEFRTEPMIVTGNFSFSLESWGPTMTLPVKLPGVLESPSGIPEITGFEFMFREPDSELKRAEISLNPDAKHFSLKMMVLMAHSPADSLFQRASHLLGKHLGLLAVRKGRAEALKNV